MHIYFMYVVISNCTCTHVVLEYVHTHTCVYVKLHVCMWYIHEAQHQVMVVGKLIFLLVSPHTEIMGVTQNNFYRLHLGFMNNFFFGFSCTNY